MARRRLPTVGPRQLAQVRLAPRERAILHRRAVGAARRENLPAIRAARRAVGIEKLGYGQAKQAFRTERKSVIGATNLFDAYAARALRGAKTSGLRGRYRQEVLGEITSRRQDAASSIPFLLADAAQQRAEDIANVRQNVLEARQGVTEARAGQKTDVATAFNQLLKEARTAGASELKSRQTRRREARQKATEAQADFTKEVTDALHEAGRLLRQNPKKLPQLHAQSVNKKIEAWWAGFQDAISNAEGVGLRAARIAAERLRKRIEGRWRRGPEWQIGG